MSQVHVIKTPQGWSPADDESREVHKRHKLGAYCSAEFKQMRNYRFLKKMHSLYTLAFEHFCEYGDPGVTYKGEKVAPNYNRFRKDLTILAGHYNATFNIRGEIRLEAKSISYAQCTEDEAEKIFSDVLNAALKNVYKSKVSEVELRELVSRILEYA